MSRADPLPHGAVYHVSLDSKEGEVGEIAYHVSLDSKEGEEITIGKVK
jgi:hypothetical protein